MNALKFKPRFIIVYISGAEPGIRIEIVKKMTESCRVGPVLGPSISRPRTEKLDIALKLSEISYPPVPPHAFTNLALTGAELTQHPIVQQLEEKAKSEMI